MSREEEPQITSKHGTLQEQKDVKSSIPVHLMSNLDEHERYLVETLSRLEQQIAWCIQHIIAGNKADIDNDVRLQYVERWKTRFNAKTGLILWLLTTISVAAINALAAWLWKKFSI